MVRALVVACLVAVASMAVAQSKVTAMEHFANRRAEKFVVPVPEILKRALKASNRGRFSGRREVQYLHGQRSDSHEEIVFREGDKSRVEFPEGSRFAGEIIVENGLERRHYLPGKNEVLISPPRHEESLMRLQKLVRRGRLGKVNISEAPGERVAGFQTDQIVVSDAAGNTVQRLFVELRTGLVLKRQIFDPGGALVGQFLFTQIDLNPAPFDPSIFKFERKGVRVVQPIDSLREIASPAGFEPVVLPTSTGYRLDDSRISRIGGTDVLVESYWSPHGKLTLFELRTNVRDDMLQRFNRDDIHTTAWQFGGKFYVLVGNLDVATLVKVRQSITPGTP